MLIELLTGPEPPARIRRVVITGAAGYVAQRMSPELTSTASPSSAPRTTPTPRRPAPSRSPIGSRAISAPFQFFGGVTTAVVCDQLKSGVTLSCRYEPGLQRTYEEFAQHHGTVILPARPAHPRDKPKIEVAVQIVERWILGVDGGPTGPVSRRAAARAVAWCEYLQGHARRLYASVTDQARVAAALLAAQLTHGRLPSPFTARDVCRNEWTALTEPRVVQGALEGLAQLGWLRPEAVRVRDGGRPTVRFHINPRLLAGRHDRSRNVAPEAS